MTDLKMPPAVPFKDVEWRVDGKPSNNRCRFVPYIGAATAARLLDEWAGPGNWSDVYEESMFQSKPAIWCHLSVKVGDEWVTKRDVGVPTQFEPQKGGVSDAFKRAACLKWGVGRNVYTLPTLWAPCKVWTDRNGKENAAPNNESLPSIWKQLKEMGYEPSGKLAEDVQQAETSEPAKAPVPEPQPTSSEQPVNGADKRPVAQIEVGGPCPHCGSDVGRWISSNPQAPKWRCTNPGCTAGKDETPWVSWHDDPWKSGGEIEQMKASPSEAGVSDTAVTDVAQVGSESSVRQAGGDVNSNPSPSAVASEPEPDAWAEVQQWAKDNFIGGPQVVKIGSAVALRMKAREDGRRFVKEDLFALPPEVAEATLAELKDWKRKQDEVQAASQEPMNV